MPTLTSGKPAPRLDTLSSSMAWAISTAARTARVAWSGLSTGAPQKAMTLSPMYLSTVPPWRLMISDSRLKMRLRKACSSTGASVSDSRVKPRMSQKSAVSSLLSARML